MALLWDRRELDGRAVFVFSLQEQLRHLYPRIKVLSFGAKPESALHTYLPSFLSRATPHCPDDMKKEVRGEGPPLRSSEGGKGWLALTMSLFLLRSCSAA